MKLWFYSRQPQEQLALIAMAVIIIGLLIYTMLWLPLNDDIAKKQVWVNEQQEMLSWMEQTASKISHFQTNIKTGQNKTGGEALLTTVDRTAKQARLRDTVKRLKPQGNDKVQLWLEEASFDRTIRWLDVLQQKHNISVGTITIEKKRAPGMIDARINLERS